MDNEQYLKDVQSIARVINQQLTTHKEDETSAYKEPSTGNPYDYLEVIDLTDINRGKRVGYNTRKMPDEAGSTLALWLQAKTHKRLADQLIPLAEEFERIMGFSPQTLMKEKGKLEKEIK